MFVTKLKKNNGGFIALISVIIISAILLIVTTTLSMTNFYGRANILSFELKERSRAIAEGCADTGLLFITNNTSHPATTTLTVGKNTCFLGPIPTSGNPRIFFAKATTTNYSTTLKISVNPTNNAIISWEEIP